MHLSCRKKEYTECKMIRRLLLPGATLLAAGIAAVVYLHLHSADIPVLNPQGPVALGERSVMFVTLLLCSIVIVPVFVLLFYFAWKYRADHPKTHEHHRPDWDHTSTVAELIWWCVPAVIVAILSVVAWQSSHALDPYKPLVSNQPPLVVEVVALDWKWLFIYPSLGIATVNMVEFPLNRPVRFELTADAPMNSFWIPSLGGQIMVMPGMQTELNLMASNVGTFNGSSANISGKGFAGMSFSVKSVSNNDFQNWVQSVRQSSNPLTKDTYATLALPTEYAGVSEYSSVDDSLYTGVIMKFMTPDVGNMSMTMTP
jgi:cytochrome o ubiquinol oxidase subunit II